MVDGLMGDGRFYGVIEWALGFRKYRLHDMT